MQKKYENRTDHQGMYRANHPKISYNTAKEAARALNETRRSNKGTNYEGSNCRLNIFYDGDDRHYYIGHEARRQH